MVLYGIHLHLREFFAPLNESDHTPDPYKFFDMLIEQGVPADQLENYVRNIYYTASLSKRERQWLRGVLAGLEGAHSD